MKLTRRVWVWIGAVVLLLVLIDLITTKVERGVVLDRPTSTRWKMENICSALEDYHDKMGAFPGTNQDLMGQFRAHRFEVFSVNTQVPALDGWGHTLRYAVSGEKAYVASWGSDGIPNTTDDIVMVIISQGVGLGCTTKVVAVDGWLSR